MQLQRSILIVDDDPLVREILKLNLRGAGFETRTASNGAEALQMLHQMQFNLVILDVMMPEVDGWEVCKSIKDDPDLHETKVLLLTGRTGERNKVIGTEIFKADEYMPKPFDMGTLIQKVRSMADGSTT